MLPTLSLPVTLTPEAIAELRKFARLLPEDIDLIAAAVAQKLLEAPMALTVKQFAARIGKSPSYVHAEIRAGRLRAKRMGGNGDRAITPEDASAWMNRGGRNG